MKLRLILLSVISLNFLNIFATVIGVANGSATTDGRPLMWKSRDIETEQVVRYFDNGSNRFIGVGSTGASYIWMGINDKGFAISNSLANDLDRTMGNGGLMMYCLPRCDTLEEFEAILDSTNLTGRETNGNFAVIDSTGAAAMYEIGSWSYSKFDTMDAENGFIVRTNYSPGGRDDDFIGYIRSNNVLQELLLSDSINYRSILQIHSRDFCDYYIDPYDIPYQGYTNNDISWGYIPSNYSICSDDTRAVAVFRGVLTGESPCLSTMWTMLGHPTCAIAFPIFPVGEPPMEANTQDSSALYTRAAEIRAHVFDLSNNSKYVDTYKLRNEDGTGLWDQIFPMEDQLFDEFDEYFDSWTNEMPDDETILETQQAMATEAYDFLMDVTVDSLTATYFVADHTKLHPPATITFADMSLHGVESWRWDFDNDGEIDSYSRCPQHLYDSPGVYTVKLITICDGVRDSLVRENYINMVNRAPEFISYSPQEMEMTVVENEYVMFTMDHEDMDDEIITHKWYLDSEEFTHTFHTISICFDEIGDHTVDCEINDGFTSSWLNWLIHVEPLSDDDPTVPQYDWSLANYPNPFNPSTIVSFTLKHESPVRIDIYDVRGRKVRTLADAFYDAGQHHVSWNGTNDRGQDVASGVYLLKLTTDDVNLMRKALLVK